MIRTTYLITTLGLLICTGCHTTTKTTTADTAGTTAAYYQDGGTYTYTAQAASATATDQSGVCVADSGTLDLSSSTVSTTGSTSSASDSNAYGLNAAVLAKTASTINLSSSSITSSGSGASGVFAIGSGSAANLTDVTIVTTGAYAHGAEVATSGVITLVGCTVTTSGAYASGIGMNNGSGTVTVTGGTFTTSGAQAPVIHSQGAVTVLNGTMSATLSDASVIQGGNSITLSGTALSTLGAGARSCLIFQSGTDAVTGTFTMTGGSLATASGPLFFVSNITGAIHLNGVSLSAGSGVIVEAGATSSTTGGIAVLTATGQTLMGNLVTDDDISSISASLQSSSRLTGVINQAALTLDASSTWTLTGTSHLTTLSDAAGISGSNVTNIVGNGFNVTYDSTLAGNSTLNGGTFALAGGGQLLPKSAE